MMISNCHNDSIKDTGSRIGAMHTQKPQIESWIGDDTYVHIAYPMDGLPSG